MKNWKTTVAGVIVAVLAAGETLLPYLEGTEELNWVQIISAVAIAVFGTLVKDHDKDDNEELLSASSDTINPDPKPPRP